MYFMKTFLFTLFCLSTTASFAQNGFFLQAETGAGISNMTMEPFSPLGYPDQSNVFGYQGQVDAGYKAGKWQFVSGIGYLRTGVKMSPGLTEGFYGTFGEGTSTQVVKIVTDYNPHLLLPVKVGYEAIRFSNKLSFTPFVGAEFLYNMPRTFIVSPIAGNSKIPETKHTESQQEFDGSCNRIGVAGLVQLSFEYRLNDRYDITAGPSVHYMLTSELNFGPEQDYSVLMNLGLKWNFKKRQHSSSSQQ
jgi:hypothetical protein